MKFSFNRNHLSVLITLIFVLFFGASYFFIYVPHNEKDLQEQRFRTLQNIDNNINEKIKNSVALMSNLLKGKVDTGYINYLAAQSKGLFTLSLRQIKAAPVNDSGRSIMVDNTNQRIILLLPGHSIDRDNTVNYQMEMKWSFDQFMAPLLPKNVFDQYIIFNDGEVVYETFPSGISYFKDSLSDRKNGIITSSIKSLNVSGTDYKLFSQPVSFITNNEWVITGLLSDKRYQQEKGQLPSNAVLLLATIVLIIIVVYPWLKLYQMGNKDRLTIIDGVSSIAVSMLLISLLFFTFFKYNLTLRPDSSPDSKDTLARQITTAFQNEISNAWQKLHSFDDSLQLHLQLFKKSNLINLDDSTKIDLTDNSKKENHIIHDSLMPLQAIAASIHLYQVFWLDKNGVETINWTTESRNAAHTSFKTRDYFKKITGNKEYILQNDTSRKFYLDQLVSWTSGTFRSVISVPSAVPGQSVAAMSFDMRSLYKPVLPEGYQFAIIDPTGKVLYHSDVTRNLNENLLSEFSSHDNLSSCLQARTEGAFKTKYFSKEYSITVKPVEKLPYFIIIFSDTSYKETRDMEIYSFTFCMLLLFFGFLILELFGVFLVSSRRSFFKRQSYDTSWIGPKISSHHDYNLAVLTNIIITVLALSFFRISTFLTYLYILMFSVTSLSLSLNTLFARRYKKNKQADNYTHKIIAIRWLILFISVINVAAVRTLDWNSIFVLLAYELITLIAGLLIHISGDTILVKIRAHTNARFLAVWNYVHSFSLMALTRLIITSGIPVVFFYITSYNYEQNISIRYRQLQYANKLLDTLNDHQLDTIKFNQDFARGFYYDGAWIKSIDTTGIDTAFAKNNDPLKYSVEENLTAKILGMFRININDKAVNERKFYTTHEADTLFYFNPLLKNACKNDSATITFRQTHVPGRYLKITAFGLNYRLPSVFSNASFNGFLFWLFLFIALIIFYFIIYNIIRKLFCIGLPDLSAWKELDDKIITNANVNNLLFIIGLPGSGKLSMILERIKKGEILNGEAPLIYNANDDASGNVFIADLINIPDFGENREENESWKALRTKVFNTKNKLIIVNHFEYNIEDAVTNRIKLNLLQALMLDNKCKIIILSTIHPVAFLDSVTDQSIDQGDTSSPGQDLERWHVLLGHYRIVIFPLQQLPATEVDNAWKSVYKETQQTHFLARIQEDAVHIAMGLTAKQRAVNADELAFKLQVTAHYFYMYIWQSLTKEEKFLLYDLAEDNLVNSYDDYNLSMLLAKGVIMRPDGTLKLFNKGFRNFILTAIGNNEAMKIKRNITDNGNWGRLKNPLLIVVLAILAFLLTSQQEAYSRIITYAAALATGIPAILKLLSVFDKGDKKAAETK